MRFKFSLVMAVTLFIAASCGSGSSEQAQPTSETQPAAAVDSAPEVDSETLPELAEPTDSSCGAEIPTEGPSIEDFRSGLAAFRASDADPIALANTYASMPDFPVSDGAEFVTFAISMTDEGSEQFTYGTTLVYQEPDTADLVVDRYSAFASELGWVFESDEVSPALTVMSLESAETGEKFRISYSFTGTRATGSLDVQYLASRDADVKGDPSVWHQWHVEELPYVEGYCYKGGGASTNIEHPDSISTIGGPGDNITVDLAYADMTVDEFYAKMIPNAEAAGFTVEAGNVDGIYKFSKGDYVIQYQASEAASINGILVGASANYPT